MLIRIRAALALTVLCVAGPALVQSALAVTEAEARMAAETMSQSVQNAYNANKASDVAALFVQGGIWLTPGGTMLTDPKDMEKAVAGRIQAGWTNQTLRVIEAHPVGDDVWYVMEYKIDGTGANAGKQISGYTAQLMTREASGWRLKLIAANIKPLQDITGMAAATSK